MALDKAGKDLKQFLFTLNEDETEEALRILRQHRDNQMFLKGNSFDPGDYVKFNTKKGETIVGTVIKINRKTLSVTEPKGIKKQWSVRWTVHPSFIEPATKEEYDKFIEEGVI